MAEYPEILNSKARDFFNIVNKNEFNDILNPLIKKLFETHIVKNEWRTYSGDLMKIVDGQLQLRRYRCKYFNSINVIPDWQKELDDNVYEFLREFEPDLLPLIKKAIYIIEDVDEIKEPDKMIVLSKTITKPIEYLKGSWGGLSIECKKEHKVELSLTSLKGNIWHKRDETKYEYIKDFSKIDSDFHGILLDDELFETYKYIYSKGIEYYEALIKDVDLVKKRAMSVILESKYGPDLTALQV